MDVGGELRQARTARKLSLGDVSARTKINQSILRAIEENRFDRVPGGLFTRGYLRAFAREVHLDPEVIVTKYRAEFEQPIVELPSPEKVAHRVPVYSLTADGTQDRRRFVGLAIVLLIGAAYFGYARTRSSTPAPPIVVTPAAVRSPATDAVEAAAPAPVPTPTTGTVETPQAGPLKLAMETKGDCWVSATIDGKPAIARLMKAGDTLAVRRERSRGAADWRSGCVRLHAQRYPWPSIRNRPHRSEPDIRSAELQVGPARKTPLIGVGVGWPPPCIRIADTFFRRGE